MQDARINYLEQIKKNDLHNDTIACCITVQRHESRPLDVI